jgi:hypothetical protein
MNDSSRVGVRGGCPEFAFLKIGVLLFATNDLTLSPYTIPLRPLVFLIEADIV